MCVEPFVFGQHLGEKNLAPGVFIFGLYGTPVIAGFAYNPAVVHRLEVSLYLILFQADVVVGGVQECFIRCARQDLAQIDAVCSRQVLDVVT